MSCVPSINAYVATHTCHQDETEKAVTPPAKPLHTIPPEPEKVQKSWLGSFMDKFMFLGHDGVGLTSTEACTKLEKSSSDETDSNKSSIDILSRVRHLSNDSMASTDESTASSSSSGMLSDRARHLSNPER